MSHQSQITAHEKVLELLTENGFEGMFEAIVVLFNEAMKLERSQNHIGYANSCKRKALAMRGLANCLLRYPKHVIWSSITVHLNAENAAREHRNSPWQRYSTSSRTLDTMSLSLEPKGHRTTNLLERINRELKHRTCVATLFPNPDSVFRLTSAVLMEISEEWETACRYINLETT